MQKGNLHTSDEISDFEENRGVILVLGDIQSCNQKASNKFVMRGHHENFSCLLIKAELFWFTCKEQSKREVT